MADFIIRFVMQIAKAERAGIETVFIRRRRRGDHRAVQLGMPPYGHVKAAVASKQSGLFLHRVEGALHLVLAGADVAGAGHTAKGKAAARRHAGLLRVVIVAILLTAQPEIAAYVGHNLLAVDLCAVQYGVTPAGHRDLAAAVDRGFGPGGAIAFFITFRSIHVGKDADARPRYRRQC